MANLWILLDIITLPVKSAVFDSEISLVNIFSVKVLVKLTDSHLDDFN